MMPFFQPDRAGAFWRVVGPEIGLLLGWIANSGCDAAGLQSLDVALLYNDKKGRKGRRGLRPWPLRCLSQFLSKRKDRLLRGRMCCVCLRTFHRWGGLVFIVYVFPSLMVTRILSHWTEYFLPLSVSDSIRDIEGIVYLEVSFSLIGEIRLYL